MSLPFLCLTAILLILQVTLPRRYAFLPLLIAVCHTGKENVVGSFTIIRLLLIIGILRAVAGGYFKWSVRNRLDFLIVFFGLTTLATSLTHHDPAFQLSPAAGTVLDVVGAYLYARVFVDDTEAIVRVAKCLAFVLLPLALLMAFEQQTGHNAYVDMGARVIIAAVREGHTRAQGPFGHSILAGTAGASALPLMIYLWKDYRRTAFIGIFSALVITASSASSGPLGTAAIAIGSLILWRWRLSLGRIKLAAIMTLVVLQLFMSRPIWFLLARIDLVGGSTGWHRAELIQSGIDHLGQWWLHGTDFTRDWMPTGAGWNANQADITNYYLALGVRGGLALMLCLIFILFVAGSALGRRIREMREEEDPREFLLWCVGSTVFAHAVTFLTISYFDQMFALFYLVIGAVPGLVKATAPDTYEENTEVEDASDEEADNSASENVRRAHPSHQW